MNYRTFSFGVIIPLLLVGCTTTPLSSVDHNKYKTVAISTDVKAPDHHIYRDATGERARGVGNNFGLVGALVGGAIGANSEDAGLKRFNATAVREKIDIKNLVRSHFVATLKTSQMFQIAQTNSDAEFHLEIMNYGVGPVNGQQLGGVIQAKAMLTARNGQSIWQRMDVAKSKTTGLLEDYEKNPRLWPRVIDEAAEQLARQMILYSKTQNQ